MAEDCKMLASTPEGGANRGPDAAQPPMAEATAPAWSRLIALPPHSEIGVIDLRPRIAALGKDVFKSTAQISADARIRLAALTIYTRKHDLHPSRDPDLAPFGLCPPLATHSPAPHAAANTARSAARTKTMTSICTT